MVKKAMYQKIQSFKKQGKSKSQISGLLSISKKTVKKYYSMEESKYLKYQRKLLNRDKVFDNYRDDILEIYEKNDNRRLNMASVYDYLEEKYVTLPGNEKTLRNYIKYLVETEAIIFQENRRTYKKVPDLPYGRQMQLDFGEYKMRNGLKLYIFAGVLSASRYKYIKFQIKPFRTIDVILHLLDCFDYYGGMPEELVIDQDKLMVVSENHGDIIYTRDFENFKSEMGFKMYVCRKSDPETKGKVENTIKYVKANFLSTREFETEEEANISLFNWLNRRGNGKISQATKMIPLEVIEEERNYLKKPRNSIYRKDSLLGREERTVSDNYISVHACYYGFPGKYEKKTVEIYVTRDKVFIFDINTGEEITNYNLSLLPGKKIMHREFKRNAKVSLKELKEEAYKMFDLDRWEIFLNENFKKFSRYNRDQCIEARKYFGKENINKVVLDTALEYCLGAETFSFSNLNDTYKYYLTMHKEGVEYFGKETIKSWHKDFYNHPPIDVKKRDMQEYRKIAASGGTR